MSLHRRLDERFGDKFHTSPGKEQQLLSCSALPQLTLNLLAPTTVGARINP